MEEQNTESGIESRPRWEDLEAFARQGIQTWLQRLLEDRAGRRRRGQSLDDVPLPLGFTGQTRPSKPAARRLATTLPPTYESSSSVTFTQLRAFVTVFEARSLTRAAGILELKGPDLP